MDEFTGRIMEGRKWAEGLHSAIEAKENIYNMEGSETIASITYQNFFRLYPKIAGMTGTAKTEELEFENIYNLSVSVLPTFKPIKRIDLPDAIYIDEISKWKAVAQECQKMYTSRTPCFSRNHNNPKLRNSFSFITRLSNTTSVAKCKTRKY